MITCTNFRTSLQPGTDQPALLEHLRHCDACLDFAMTVDPDLFFRSLGGEELVPPGGIDAFAEDVMAQIRVRQAETSLAPRPAPGIWRRLAIAATIAAGITGAMLAYRFERNSTAPAASTAIALAARPAMHARPTATKSFVETYSSHDATIVEMPNDGSDTKVVMIFDDKLPADL